MKLRAAIAVLVVVTLAQAACDAGGAALVGVVQLESGVQATCVSLTVTEPSTSRPLGEAHAALDPAQTEYRFAVSKKGPNGTLPDEVVLQAHALAGPNGCAAPLVEVSASDAVQRRFPAAGSEQVPLTVPRPKAVPDALQFQATGPVLHAGDCVNTAVRTMLSGALTPVPADTPIDFAADPDDGGISFFTDGTCGAAVSRATLPAGSAVLPVQLRGLAAGAYTLTASASGMDSGTASVSVALTQATAIDFSSAAFTALSGTCLGPVRLRAEDAAGNPTLLASDATISLTATASGVTFYSDAACTAAVSSVLLAAGQPEVTFWFQPKAAGAVGLRASAGSLGNPTQTQQIVPNVRTGTCTLDAGTSALSCPIDAPGVFDLSKAFVVVQAISNDDNPNGVNVRCRLADAGTIDCSRAGSTGSVDVEWQLVELSSGVHVQRVDNTQCPGNLITLPQAVDPAQTFLLFTAEGSGNTVDYNDYRTVRLVSSNQVEVLNSADCDNGTLDVQVVEFQGAFVERGVLDAGTVNTVSVTTPTSIDLTRTFLLHSARFTGSTPLCGYQLRGQLTSANTITFTRGNGNDVPCQTPDITAIAWERVQLPLGAFSEQVLVSMPDGQSTTTASISPVDPARSFAFGSSNLNGGPAFGETNYNADDVPGAVGARMSLATGSRLQLDRSVDAGSAKWTSYVVELP